jgi:hypothetical protein
MLWLPYVLAAFFALASLRGIAGGSITDTDAARHFMNGAFVHDLIADGQVMHPIEYGKNYYAHLPVVSIPYHPPLFPAIEALFFFVFGVKVTVARALVALSVGISALLFYLLLRATHGSELLAACAVTGMFSLWLSQLVATEVMLEFPSLAFTLAALYCLRDFERGYTLRRALLFALLAAAAVWTKQFAVFLGAVPPILAFSRKRWSVLYGKAMWISTALFACAVKALMSLSGLLNRTGVDQVPTESNALLQMVRRNLDYYGPEIVKSMLGLPGLFTVCAAVSLAWLIYRGAWRDLRLGIYAIWAVLAAGIVLLVPHDTRYCFNLFPPLMAIGFILLYRAGSLRVGRVSARAIAPVFASAWLIAGLSFQPDFLRGPAAAAAVVVGSGPARVIYFGEADGNFAAAVRLLDPNLATTVIPGEKLPPESFHAAPFEQLCRRYGVGWIVIENYSVKAMQAKWARPARLLAAPAPSMKLERSIPLESSRTRWHGTIEVYRFTAATQPEQTLVLPVRKIRSTIALKPEQSGAGRPR